MLGEQGEQEQLQVGAPELAAATECAVQVAGRPAPAGEGKAPEVMAALADGVVMMMHRVMQAVEEVHGESSR